jgi:lysosomal alpha-mannosidase
MSQTDEFANVVHQQAVNYRSNNIMLTMGGDFTYMAAQMYFKQMDKLIK